VAAPARPAGCLRLLRPAAAADPAHRCPVRRSPARTLLRAPRAAAAAVRHLRSPAQAAAGRAAARTRAAVALVAAARAAPNPAARNQVVHRAVRPGRAEARAAVRPCRAAWPACRASGSRCPAPAVRAVVAPRAPLRAAATRLTPTVAGRRAVPRTKVFSEARAAAAAAHSPRALAVVPKAAPRAVVPKVGAEPKAAVPRVAVRRVAGRPAAAVRLAAVQLVACRAAVVAPPAVVRAVFRLRVVPVAAAGAQDPLAAAVPAAVA